MSPTPAEYEEIVEGLLRLAVKRDGYDNLITHRLKKHRGKSGHEHAIDVSFELTIAGLQFLVIVECKCYQHRVGIDDVMELAYRVRDIGANKGVLVTTCGFQAGAIAVAKAEGIGLLIAARGKMQTYKGSVYSVWKYWLNSLYFDFDQDSQSLRLLPERVAVGNQDAFITSIDSEPGCELVFVLPRDLPESDVSLFDVQNGKTVTRVVEYEWGSSQSKYEYRDGCVQLIGGELPRKEVCREENGVALDQEPIA